MTDDLTSELPSRRCRTRTPWAGRREQRSVQWTPRKQHSLSWEIQLMTSTQSTWQAQHCTLYAPSWLTSTRRPWPYTKEIRRTEKWLLFFLCYEIKEISPILVWELEQHSHYSYLYLYLKDIQILDTAGVIHWIIEHNLFSWTHI